VLVDPKTTMGNNCEKQPASGPSMNEVQLLVSVAGAEKGHDRILGGEEEDNRKLRDCHETYDWVR